LIDATPGLAAIKLEPPMRQSLRQVRFSPDGNYILAQNQSAIHVLSRSPLKQLFTIEAQDAELAHFTPDSKHVVFHFLTMRVEKWSIAEQKRKSFHELVDYEGCMQSSLSPDGRSFVCLSRTDAGVWLKMTDVESDKRFFDNKTMFGSTFTGADIVVRTGGGRRLGTVAYSQDGRTMLILVGTKSIAFDLDERKPISLGRDLSHIVDGRVSFVDSDKLVYQCDWGEDQGGSKDTFKICESSFPDGLAVNNFRVGYQWIESVSKGNHILIGPFKDNAAMLVDPSTGKASAGFKLDSLDIFGDVLASENENGGITVGAIGSQQIEKLDLPVSPITDVEAAGFSPDGKFLAYSTKTRSSIWDLTTQKRVSLMRPFREVRFDPQDVMFAQFQQASQKPGANYQIDLKTGKSAETSKYAIDQFQRGDVLVTFQPLEKTGDISSNVNIQVADGVTGAPLWSKHFAHETPIVRSTEDGTLLFIIDLFDDGATPEMNHAGAKLVKSPDTKSEWLKQGLLIEILDSRTGDIIRALQVPQRAGVAPRTASLFGDYLVVRGIYNNSTIYRITDGQRLGAFSGRVIAGDGKLGLIAATNRDQDVIVYDATNGRELKRVTVDHLPRVAKFIPAKNALLVLTANQQVFSIDFPPTGHAESPRGQ
jgi:WD40 repeat protein